MKKSNIVVFLILFILTPCVYSNILVVAPHPDDDALIAAGVVNAANRRGETATVVFMTNGDFLGLGDLRQDEAVNAQTTVLGTPENNLIFLGYPDASLQTLYEDFPLQTDHFENAASGHKETYAHRGLGATDYHNFRFGSHADYNGFNILKDLKDIIDLNRPEHIITVTEFDQHADHATTAKIVMDAINAVSAADPGYVPVLDKMMVWPTDPNVWPLPANPITYFTEPPGLAGTGLVWNNRVSLDVPLSMQATDITNLKQQAIDSHDSQGGNTGFIAKFVHKDEFFWPVSLTGGNLPPLVNAGLDQIAVPGSTVTLNGNNSRDPENATLTYQWRQISGTTVGLSNPTSATPSFTAPPAISSEQHLVFELRVTDGNLNTLPDFVTINIPANGIVIQNIAPTATVTASSQNISTNQQAVKAVDGVVDGYPGDFTKEWATSNERAGAWIQLNWSSNFEVTRIVLHDRPNANDQITSATITFANGTSINTSALDNNGTGVELTFAPIITNSIRLTVTTVSGSTQNVGLAEFEVYGTPPTGGNLAPIANAGVDQTVAQGVTVNLNGGGSFDPDNTPLVSYVWTQTAGPTVTLTNANTATPSFIAPSNLTATTTLTFSLVVNDGQVNSTPDSVNIVVSAGTSTDSNVAPLASVTASSQNTNTDQLASKAVDGVADGYPGDFTREWATTGGGAGSWLQLNWSTTYQISRVVLYDRPNSNDQITSATLLFSDGSTINVGSLTNNGTGVTVNFTPKLANSLRMTVTTVSGTTQNVGLAEIEVFGTVPQTGNLPPVANAGPDQTVNEGAQVNLDGRLSSDPNNNPLTYQWTQVSGPAVSLTGALSATPSFSAPTGLTSTTLLTFSLVVNDGQLNSVTDTVVITVTPLATPLPVAGVSPAGPIAFGNQIVNTSSAAQSVTLTNTGNAPLAISSITATSPFAQSNNCGTALPASASCTINVTFTPTNISNANGVLTITDNSNGIAGSVQTVTLSGTGIANPVPPIPSTVRDDFNRANATTLGAAWLQSKNLLGSAVIRVNTNQAVANLNLSTGYAYLNTVNPATQAAGFTYANTTLNNTALFLKASGALGASSGQMQNAVRVIYNAGTIRVATTTNGNATNPTYTNVGVAISTNGNLASGNSLMASVDSSGKVWVWKRVGTTVTLLTPTGVQLPNNSLWTTGGGMAGIRLPNGARIDNFVTY